MKNLIKIDNLNFNYDSKKIFNNFNLKIKKGCFMTILGSSGSGKTTLIKILSGKIKYDGNIIIDELDLHDVLKNKKLGFCFDISNINFTQDKVSDELYALATKNKISKDKVEELVNSLEIENLLNYSPNYLSSSQRQFISLVKQFILEPQILILDDGLSMLDENQRKTIFKYLKKLNKDKKTTIINITGNPDDSIYGSDISIIHDGSILINDKKEIVLEDERVFKKANLNLPFMADLSIKLKYYDLLDKVVLDKNKMVNLLWK